MVPFLVSCWQASAAFHRGSPWDCLSVSKMRQLAFPRKSGVREDGECCSVSCDLALEVICTSFWWSYGMVLIQSERGLYTAWVPGSGGAILGIGCHIYHLTSLPIQPVRYYSFFFLLIRPTVSCLRLYSVLKSKFSSSKCSFQYIIAEWLNKLHIAFRKLKV